MAFKFITLFALLACANAGYLAPATYAPAPTLEYGNSGTESVAYTHQNVRSFDGTVSSHPKAVLNTYNREHQMDTRSNNNVYTPVVAKNDAYAAPAAAKNPVNDVVYHHNAPKITKTVNYASADAIKPIEESDVYTQAAPVEAKNIYTHEKPFAYSQPAVHKTVAYSTPAVRSSYNHGPDATTYSHKASRVSDYGTSHTVHYSPADMVSHMSFDGFGTHWGY